jgi:putative transport protein
MIQLLLDNPLLLLVVVAALGYVLGQISIKGSSLGVAAVLFAGLGIGALHPGLQLPEFVTLLGLVLFVYTIGLSSGPGFFASFRRKGVRDNLLVLGVLLLATGLTVGAYVVLDLSGALTAGLFAGSLTNTPALASVLEQIRTVLPPEAARQMLDDPVVGYSIAYPVGIVGLILAIAILQRWWDVDYQQEAQDLRELGGVGRTLESYTIHVLRPEVVGKSVAELQQAHDWDVLFGRIRRAGERSLGLVEDDTVLRMGDLVTVIGEHDAMRQVVEVLGERSDEQLELDRSEYDFRRIFVSNPKVAGQRVGDLDLFEQFGAIATRVRRGDVEWLVTDDTVLEPGDRVRVVAKPELMPAVTRFFGDSYRALSEINLLTFNLGLMVGLLLGLVPIPLPGGITLKLGLAGGPLIAGLVLGKLGRTGPLVWHLPYSANLLLRQVGLVLFFAGVGTRAGRAFFETLTGAGGLVIFAAGAVITCFTALTMLWIGYKVFRIPMSLLTGMLAGLQTQPAVLSYALEQSRNELPNIGYATVFPVATIAKILLAQLILTLLM